MHIFVSKTEQNQRNFVPKTEQNQIYFVLKTDYSYAKRTIPIIFVKVNQKSQGGPTQSKDRADKTLL